MDHEFQAAGRTWKNQVKHNSGEVGDCFQTRFDNSSHCVFSIPVFDYIPKTAKAVKFRVKAKTWAMKNLEERAYCLVYASLASSLKSSSDHFVHSEVSGNMSEIRRVTFSTVEAFIKDDRVAFEVGREIVGECVSEIGFTIEGYWE